MNALDFLGDIVQEKSGEEGGHGSDQEAEADHEAEARDDVHDRLHPRRFDRHDVGEGGVDDRPDGREHGERQADGLEQDAPERGREELGEGESRLGEHGVQRAPIGQVRSLR
jgi:hypothetical protein